MKVTIELNTDNASMETEEDFQVEIIRIFTGIATKITNGLEYCKIRDINGNTIGYYQVENMPGFEEVENNEDN